MVRLPPENTRVERLQQHYVLLDRILRIDVSDGIILRWKRKVANVSAKSRVNDTGIWKFHGVHHARALRCWNMLGYKGAAASQCSDSPEFLANTYYRCRSMRRSDNQRMHLVSVHYRTPSFSSDLIRHEDVVKSDGERLNARVIDYTSVDTHRVIPAIRRMRS